MTSRHATAAVRRIGVGPDERQIVEHLLDAIEARFPHPDSEGFLAESAHLSGQIPAAVREHLTALRAREGSAAIVLAMPGLLGSLPPTPSDPESIDQFSVRRPGFGLAVFAALLGEVFAWSTQQAGRFVHDVMPVRGREDEQVGFGSRMPLSWHTEDAFHDFRGDFLGMLCLRNRCGVPTTLAFVDSVRLDPHIVETLHAPRFVIHADNSHRTGGSRDEVGRPGAGAGGVPALFEDEKRLCLRIDPDFMSPVPGDEEAGAALRALRAELDRNLQDVILRPGDLLFVDNYRAVHGRRAFTPAYDGLDRWLRRVNISSDLRRARSAGRCVGRTML